MSQTNQLHYTIKLVDFLDILAHDRHKVNDDYLRYIADVLLRYKVLDRPLITGDVSPCGRSILYSLISHYNLNDTKHLDKKFRHPRHLNAIIQYLNETQHQHNANILQDRGDCATAIRLNTICNAPLLDTLPSDTFDRDISASVDRFFNTYKENYDKAYKDDRINIPVFVGKQKRKKTIQRKTMPY